MTTLGSLKAFSQLTDDEAPLMPALFIGHGSPMNAIEENEFSLVWREIARSVPKPVSIVCISAHWETSGTFITAMPNPRTIHDFGGFPQALFDVRYPAPGDPALAEKTVSTIMTTSVGLDQRWGLDHGSWSVIRQMYPEATIPVIQVSLDRNKNASFHYELGKELAFLRKNGVLVIGSGNMVHNLGMVDWNMMKGGGYDWAMKANELFKERISSRNHPDLIHYQHLGKEAALAIPSPEHYLPLLYILGMEQTHEEIHFFNDKAVGGSLSMTSLKIG